MSSNFVQNATMRSLGLSAYRLYAQAQFWRTGPKVMINSIPKAGTHLLTSYVTTTPRLMDAHLHVRRWEAYELEPGAAPEDWTRIRLKGDNLARTLSTVRGGQVITGHLYYLTDANDLLAQRDFRVVNLVRNPRDMLVSLLYYVSGLRRHYLHDVLTSEYETERQRLLALISGPPTGKSTANGRFRPYRSVLEGFAGWVDAPGVLTLRYEDLVGARGGGSGDAQLASLNAFFDHIGQPMTPQALADVAEAGSGKRSPTLRKGRIGDWQTIFDAEIEAAFQDGLGDIARKMGY